MTTWDYVCAFAVGYMVARTLLDLILLSFDMAKSPDMAKSGGPK
jgi:hypothetical protein